MITVTSSPWSTDLTALCERLARRLHSEGAAHPETAAVALAVRGHHGVDRADLAAELGISDGELAAIEAGQVAWADQPAQLRDAARRQPGLDLARLGLA
jgi:DNA-binding XRE family transcriptional regulator